MHTVLLVDDEVFARQGLRSLIDWNACGFEVLDEADNGEDALLVLLERKPDVVITDIRMPVLDGLQLIHQVKELGKHQPAFIIISGYDDFKYAQQAVRYGVHDFILKPIDEKELSETLLRLAAKLDSDKQGRSASESLINGSIIETLIIGGADPSSLAAWEQQLHLSCRKKLYYVFAELNDHHPWMPGSEDVRQLDFKGLVRAAATALLNQNQPIYVHEHHGRLGFIVSDGFLAPYGEKLTPFLQELRELVAHDAGNRVYLYAGSAVSGLEKLRESYQTAKEALKYKYLHDEKRIVIYDEACAEPVHYIEMDSNHYQALMEAVEEQDRERLNTTIDQLFGEFVAKRYAPEAVKANIQRCVLGIIKTIRSMEGEERALASLEPIVSWFDLNLSLQELRRLFNNFMLESGVLLAGLRKEYIKGGIYRIKSYIEANYDKNISLKSIAAAFYMNPVYLGQLFKKTYGVYFNDFLLQIRIQEAKKLLRQTDMRIYEVADKVGFSNADYFVTQFEKSEGTTPSEYRNRLLEKPERRRR